MACAATRGPIRFGELTDDEYFVTYDAARAGVTYANTGIEPLVALRYFGPGVFGKSLPAIGARRN